MDITTIILITVFLTIFLVTFVGSIIYMTIVIRKLQKRKIDRDDVERNIEQLYHTIEEQTKNLNIYCDNEFKEIRSDMNSMVSRIDSNYDRLLNEINKTIK